MLGFLPFHNESFSALLCLLNEFSVCAVSTSSSFLFLVPAIACGNCYLNCQEIPLSRLLPFCSSFIMLCEEIKPLILCFLSFLLSRNEKYVAKKWRCLASACPASHHPGPPPPLVAWSSHCLPCGQLPRSSLLVNADQSLLLQLLLKTHWSVCFSWDLLWSMSFLCPGSPEAGLVSSQSHLLISLLIAFP